MRILSWNIQSGGFNGYNLDTPGPERGRVIQAAIRRQRNLGAGVVALQDAFRWDKLYGGEAGIAAHLGFKSARFTHIDDIRHRGKPHAEIGLVVAANEPIAESHVLDLETRCAHSLIFDIGKYGLQLANVYLEDNNEDIRLRQVRALMTQLNHDLPTIILGDLNTLRPNMSGASTLNRLGDIALRFTAPLLPYGQYHLRSIKSINRRQVVPLIESHGYADADLQKRPTMPSPLPVFGVDYAFYNSRVAVSDFSVIQDAQTIPASDHLPITFTADLAGDQSVRL